LYHSTVLFLFHPFQDSAEELRLRSFASADATASAIYSASLSQLKRLVYIHHIRKSELPTKCWFNTAALRVSLEVLKNTAKHPDWLVYFRLCFKYWTDTYFSFPSFRLIAQANLTVALEHGVLDRDTANAMMDDITSAGKHHKAADEAVISGLLDYDLATKSLQEAQMVTIARRFDELILFDELITGDFESPADISSEAKEFGL
jgi:hypothetical protein